MHGVDATRVARSVLRYRAGGKTIRHRPDRSDVASLSAVG
jgi:hypothetical protein